MDKSSLPDKTLMNVCWEKWDWDSDLDSAVVPDSAEVRWLTGNMISRLKMNLIYQQC